MKRAARSRQFGTVVCLAFLLLVIQGQAFAQDEASAEKVRERYTKYEFEIPMRDGVKLFTAVYAPKDTSKRYPFLLTRTPYSVSPYAWTTIAPRSDRRATSRRLDTFSFIKTPADAICPKASFNKYGLTFPTSEAPEIFK